MTVEDVRRRQASGRTMRRVVIAVALFATAVSGLVVFDQVRESRWRADCRAEHPTDPQFWQPCVNQARRDAWPL